MTASPQRFVHWNGEIVSADAARVSVFDTGFLYGDGVYETMRSYGGRVFALKLRFDTQWSVVISPRAPAWRYSTMRRMDSPECPWLPIWVGSFFAAATSRSLPLSRSRTRRHRRRTCSGS